MSLLEGINSPEDVKKLPREALPELSEELRSEIIRVCSLGGGHLASSLGAVELTVALHYLYDSARDRFVWDVGHQAYGHKIFTGRKGLIDTIRQPGGLAGFTTSSESEHDALTVGHASTSLAAALGMALARDVRFEDYAVIPIIGDGALTGGMALAALNQIGHIKPKMTIILNDNEMSISENVGAIKNYLRTMQVQPWFQQAEKTGKKALRGFDVLREFGSRAKDATRHFFDPVSANPFHAMGVRYVGPIDGHDVAQLLYYLEHIRKMDGPTMLHIVTTKGKGYKIAEADPIEWHGAGKFDPLKPVAAQKGYTWANAFGDAAIELANVDDRVWVITPAMRVGSGLDAYSKVHGNRYLDVGIAEDVAVTVGVGLALRGEKPIVAIYSTFLQRGYDQVVHDVCIENLDVVFAVDRAGLVGGDGATHQGVYDLSFLRALPNMSIAMPKDADELQSMLKKSTGTGRPQSDSLAQGQGCPRRGQTFWYLAGHRVGHLGSVARRQRGLPARPRPDARLRASSGPRQSESRRGERAVCQTAGRNAAARAGRTGRDARHHRRPRAPRRFGLGGRRNAHRPRRACRLAPAGYRRRYRAPRRPGGATRSARLRTQSNQVATREARAGTEHSTSSLGLTLFSRHLILRTADRVPPSEYP